MSLKVWLPLNGDLRNQGVSSVTITPSTSVAVQTDGKIGKCYRPATITLTNLDDFSFNNSSFCFWAKTNATTSWQLIIGIDNNNLSQIHGIYVADASRYKLEYNPSLNIYDAEIAQWHHYAFIIQSGKSQAYCDGILKATSEESVTDDIIGRLRLGVGTAISLNDVRIYDHALSAAEVREIAQGLVLHYKLDSFQGNYGNPNLCKNSRTFGTGWGGSGTVISDTFNGFAIKYKDNSSGTGSTDTVVYSSVTTVNPNEVYTVSFWAKADIAHSISCFFYNNASGIVQVSRTVASPGNSHTSGDGYINFGLTTEWKYYWITWTFGSSGNAANKTLILGRNSAGSSGISIAQVKLERGSSATPWTPHPDDDEYLPMIIEDSSGYNHHGIPSGTFSLSADTARYSYSTVFNGTNARIQVPNLTPSELTISFWMKRNANTGTRQFMYTAWNGITCELQTNGTPTFAVYRSSYPTITGTAITTDSGWVHYCATFDITTGSKLYQNGVLKSSNSNITPIAYSISTNYIGYYSTYYNGLISDFRIYCTALNAEAIRQLYEVGAKIDNKQNLHTFQLNEANTNLLSGTPWCAPFSSHTPLTSPFTNYNSDGEPQFTSNGGSAGTDYIEISPTGHTYEYDYTISVNAGNQFYIGFERYDANKTARSNNACVYTFASKPSSNIVKQHYTGTINLATDGTNPCKYIALRILNGWSGTTSGTTGTATIHSISLRQIGTKQQPKVTKTGLCIGEELKEETNTKLHKNGIIETNNLIEL